MTKHSSPVTEQTVRPFIESALRWQINFEGGRGQNNLPFKETADLITARLIAAIGAPAQQPASPATELQAVEDAIWRAHKDNFHLRMLDIYPMMAVAAVEAMRANAQSTLERIPHDDNTRLATIAECAKVADDHSRSNKTAANNMFEAGGQKSAILFMESARTCDEIAAKLRALSVTSTERVGSLFPDIGEQEPETILDSGECDCYVWPGCCPYCGGQPSTVTRPDGDTP